MAERSSRDHDKVFYLPSGEGPVLESSSICGIEPSLISRPEPSIDWLGEEIGAVTAVKVTQASRGPDIFDVWKIRINKCLATNKMGCLMRLPAAADILKINNLRSQARVGLGKRWTISCSLHQMSIAVNDELVYICTVKRVGSNN